MTEDSSVPVPIADDDRAQEETSSSGQPQIDSVPRARQDSTGAIRSAARFARADAVTLSPDQATDGWRMELWGDDRKALGLWLLSEFHGVTSSSYGEVTSLLSNVGLVDDGPEGWSESEGQWRSAVRPVEYR